MKTPMQEHIEWLKEEIAYVKKVGGGRMVGRTYTQCLEISINHAEQMLEKEKQVMCEFALKYAQADRKEPCETSTQLVFDETFNTKEK